MMVKFFFLLALCASTDTHSLCYVTLSFVRFCLRCDSLGKHQHSWHLPCQKESSVFCISQPNKLKTHWRYLMCPAGICLTLYASSKLCISTVHHCLIIQMYAVSQTTLSHSLFSLYESYILFHLFFPSSDSFFGGIFILNTQSFMMDMHSSTVVWGLKFKWCENKMYLFYTNHV